METEGKYFNTTISNLAPGSSCNVSFDGSGLYFNSNPSKNYKPTRIIIDGKVTICFFEDGEKIVVRCGKGDSFNEEIGIAEAVMRKLYGTRCKFKKAVANAEHPAHPEKKKKVKKA